jgi:tetratricopeptide (TPR) repeat protein
MGKISRNAPCPCGSGKKYKKCCLGSNEVNANKVKNTILEIAAAQKDIDEACKECEELDDLSNSVLDLIQDARFDDAEKTCNELLNRYPDQVDGLERFAMVFEARGENEKAVEYYKKTAEFARSKKGFDPEFVNWALDKAKKLGS